MTTVDVTSPRTRRRLLRASVAVVILSAGISMNAGVAAAEPPAPVCAGSAPSAPLNVSATESVPGETVQVDVTPPVCSGDSPLYWYYFYDDFGHSTQHCYVIDGTTCPAFMYTYGGSSPSGSLLVPRLNRIHVYAVNRNLGRGPEKVSEPFASLFDPCQTAACY